MLSVREGEIAHIDVRMDNGQVAHLNVSGEQLLTAFGYNTKCNRCGRPGTPATLGQTCNSFGSCPGTMMEEK